MEAKALEAGAFRDKQRESWNGVAGGWRKWSNFIDTAAGKVSERLVELAGVVPGSHVLDVAAGYGEPSLTAAKKAGADGKVVASDISAEMLAYGRERAAAAGLENIEFVVSDAMSLDFPENSFDAAVSRWGIIFDPDGEGAAARVRSFMKPGARMAIASWGTPEQVPFIARPMQTAMRELAVPPPPPGTPGPLSRPTPEAIGGLLEGGGFSDVEVKQMSVIFELPSAEEVTEYVKDIAAPITAMIEPHPPDVQEATWTAITDDFQAFARQDGTVSFTNVVLLAVGKA
jgi:SAM-dependent methyltransferase